MKKPIIIWIVAALFLFCSIPFFGQGSIVEGICGIAIAAALGVFGYLTMKRTQAAAEAEREKAEAKAQSRRRGATQGICRNARISNLPRCGRYI